MVTRVRSDGGRFSPQSVDSNYFENIDTNEKSYWLGFLFGDGTMHPDSGVKLSLSSDMDHVDRFASAVSSSYSVSTYGSYRETRISNKTFCDHLRQHGLTRNKTDSGRLPDIEEYRESFIRGLYDADGGFWTDGRRKRWSITSIDKPRLERLSEWMEEIEIGATVYSNGESAWKLEVRKNDDIERIWNNMYPKGLETEPMLERKACQIKDWVESHA